MLSRDRLIRTGGLLAVTALLAVACNTAAANKNSGLANTEWLLSIMDGSPIASGTNVTIGFGLASTGLLAVPAQAQPCAPVLGASAGCSAMAAARGEPRDAASHVRRGRGVPGGSAVPLGGGGRRPR